MNRRLVLSTAAFTAATLTAELAHAQRATGIDVSYYQSDDPAIAVPTTTSIINWATVAKPKSQGGGGIQFAFIRASRGGTTGESLTTATPPKPAYGGGSTGTASIRYDDPYFEDNMNKAKANGILSGAYHFARIDRIHSTDAAYPSYTGNTGLDEANHFLAKAGNYMRPGWLRPTLDIESGATETDTSNTSAGRAAGKVIMGAWVKEFSDRIFEVTGVRPIVYINTSYATDEIDSTVNIHDLWLARYTLYDSGVNPRPTQADADAAAAAVQTMTPPTPSGYSTPYGVFKTASNPVPWDFWQYTNAGRTPGINGYVDQDVANGDIEYVKEFLVPALWVPNADGAWTTAANWNGVTVLPTVNDRTIVDRTAGNYLVTLPSGTQTVKSLQMNERFAVTGGSLAVTQYLNLTNTTTVSGGAVTSASLNNASTLNISGGTVTTGDLTGTGTLNVTAGTLRATSLRQTSLSLTDGNVELTGTSTSVINTLTTGGDGHLDIGLAKLVIDYPVGGASPLDAVRDTLFNGDILTSAGTSAVGVGYARSTNLYTTFPAVFGTATVDSSAVLMMRALKGDATLDGVVNFDDLVPLAQDYNGTGYYWTNGDFNYDGIVNFDDLVPLAQNYNATLNAGSLIGGDNAAFAADWALAQALVPEPTCALLALPLLALRRSRI